MCIFCEEDPKIIGKFFGYPDCCINWYVNTQKKYGKGNQDHLSNYQEAFLKGTEGIGFLPCPKCAKKIIKRNLSPDKFVKKTRRATEPFPFAGEDEKTIKEFENYLNELHNN